MKAVPHTIKVERRGNELVVHLALLEGPHATLPGGILLHSEGWVDIGYGLKMRRIARREIERRVEDALALVKLSGLASRRPRQLSGGQQQRVALARALVIRPKVLLLDEPFSALDRNLRASMQVELKEIQKKLGVTTIFVTHDQSEALSLSDRIAVICDGRIRQLGTPDEIYRHPADRFVASFVGDVNVMRALIDRRDGARAVLALGNARIAVPAELLGHAEAGAVVDLFVRPEDLSVVGDGAAAAAEGVVAAQIYQGGHIDLYVDTAAAVSGRVLVRLPGRGTVTRWPPGARVCIAVTVADAVAFRPDMEG